MENDKQIESAKVNFIDKLKWRFLYKECYEKYGNDTVKINMVLNNPKILQYYKQNRKQVNDLIGLYESTLQIDSSNLFNLIMQSAERDSSKKVISNIEKSLGQVNTIRNNMEQTDEESIVNVTQQEFGEYLENYLKNTDINNFERNNYEQDIVQYTEKIEFSKQIQEKYGKDSKEIFGKYNSIIAKVDKYKELYSNNSWIYETVKKKSGEALKAGESIENIEKYVEASLCTNELKNLGENVTKCFLNNIKDVEFYYKYDKIYDSGRFFDCSDLESNCLVNNLIEKNIPIDNIIDARNRFFDARILDEVLKGNIQKIKELASKKYFGITTEDIPKKIENLPEESRRAVKIISKIYDCNRFSEIKGIMNKIDNSNFKFDNTIVDQISGQLKDEFKSTLFSIKDKETTEYVEYQGNNIPVIKLKGEDFKGIIHASSGIKGYEDISKWAGHMCTSVQSDLAYRFFSDSGVNLGYCDFENDELLHDAEINMGSGSANSGLDKNRYLKTLTFKDRGVKLTAEESAINEIDIKPRNPDYIFCFNEPNKLQKKVAYEYGCPIVTMDTKCYEKKYNDLGRKKIEYFKSNQDKLTLEDFKELVVYAKQKDMFKKSNTIGGTLNKKEYAYNTFFHRFKNLDDARANPAFLNEVMNYVGNMNGLKKYIIEKLQPNNGNIEETVNFWLDKLKEIQTEYSNELCDIHKKT